MSEVFDIPSVETLKTEILAIARGFRPKLGTGPGSWADIHATTLAHLVHGLHIHQKYGLLYQIHPTRSSGWVLSAWAWLFGLSNGSGGHGRIIARVSYAADAFRFRADTGPGWPDLYGETFADSAGQRFMINEHYTPSTDGYTSYLDVIALDTGASTNIEVAHGEAYTWESTPAQMLASITQFVDLDHGADAELDAPLRSRMARHLQSPPMGGNWASWREIAEESDPGNVDAWIWEGAHNASDYYGTTDIACTQRGEDGADRNIESTDSLYDTIDAALVAKVMYGALFRVRFLDSNAEIQNVDLTLTLNASATEAQKCDWDAESVKVHIDAYSSGNKTLTCSANISELINVGDRVVVYSAQAVVTKVGTGDGLANNKMIEVATWFTTYDAEDNPFPWASGYDPSLAKVTSGGGMILDCHKALRVDVFRPLGPHRGSGGTSAPMPGWEYVLRLQNIQSAMIGVGDAAGKAVIIDAAIGTPATDESPGTGSDTDVYFLSPGELTIWEAK